MKFKFCESASLLVMSINGGRRSVSVGAFDASGAPVSLGSVTIPPNHFVPSIDALVEVRYLYWLGPGGSVFQPVYLGERNDLDPLVATIGQIKRIRPGSHDAEQDE